MKIQKEDGFVELSNTSCRSKLNLDDCKWMIAGIVNRHKNYNHHLWAGILSRIPILSDRGLKYFVLFAYKTSQFYLLKLFWFCKTLEIITLFSWFKLSFFKKSKTFQFFSKNSGDIAFQITRFLKDS